MYVAAGIVVLCFGILGFLSRRETVDLKVSVMLRPFYRMALHIYKWTCIRKFPLFVSRQVETDLEKLHPGENGKQLCTDYYVGKLAKSMLICVVGVFLGLAISVQSKQDRILDATGTVHRGTYEEGEEKIEVECLTPDGKQEFTLSVEARVYTEEEIEQLYAAFSVSLAEYILGENDSLQQVSEDLYLREAYDGYPFCVEWKSSVSDVIRSDGTVYETTQEQEVQLQATISYETWEWEESFLIRVVPQSLSRKEQQYREMEAMILTSERENRTEETWKLPDNWQGESLTWKQKTKDKGSFLFGGAILASVLIFLLADKDLHDDVEKRRQKMRKEYPDVVHKLVLYLGAGMTIRGAFQRMAKEYEQSEKTGKSKNPVYEELLHTCRELRAGVSEGTAYEHFGKRTGLQEYIRFSTLLTQNLKKGNSTLLQRLREEAEKSSLERIQYGRRLGEEAMTKLLLPMVMMLLVVMLMIMIPAFSSMGT